MFSYIRIIISILSCFTIAFCLIVLPEQMPKIFFILVGVAFIIEGILKGFELIEKYLSYEQMD